MGEVSLPRALAITPRLVGVDFAHPLQDAAGVGLLDIRGLGPIAVSLFPLPRRRSSWFLSPLWHGPEGNHGVRESKGQHASLLRYNMESEHYQSMTPRIHSIVGCGAFMLAAWFAPITHAQEGAPPAAGSVQEELKALRQLIEQQSKQIDTLTAQITRLGGELERRNMVTPSAGLAENKDTPDVGASPAPAGAAPAGTAPTAAGTAAAPTAKVVSPAPNTHIVVKGDSLDKIAKQNNTTVADLLKLNKIADPKKLQIGQQINLPPKDPAATPAPAPEKKEGQ
jgi:LysM repeat protein